MIPSWRGTIPVYINVFNRLTSTRKLANWFESVPGTKVILVDNASTYAPLLDWYANDCKYDVIRLEQNAGHRAPWSERIIAQPELHRTLYGSDWYAVTDHDLSLENCPSDLIEVCLEGFRVRPNVLKVGVSLEIEDLPKHRRGNVIAWESQFWSRPIGGKYFDANIDTTFAVYSVDTQHSLASRSDVPCLRCDRPYTARHLPWYLDAEALPEEDQYYYAHCSASTTWKPTPAWSGGLRTDGEHRFTHPRPDCLHPEHWTADDDNSTEREVTELIAAFVRAIQPELVVETGTGLAQSAQAIGQALLANGHGRLITLEPDAGRAAFGRIRCRGLPVEVLQISSLEFVPPQVIDFAWFDSLLSLPVEEFHHFRPYYRPGAIIGFHDTGPQHPVRSTHPL